MQPYEPCQILEAGVLDESDRGVLCTASLDNTMTSPLRWERKKREIVFIYVSIFWGYLDCAPGVIWQQLLQVLRQSRDPQYSGVYLHSDPKKTRLRFSTVSGTESPRATALS